MPRGHKKDAIETARVGFRNKHSFVSLDGKLFLKGKDWHQQVMEVFTRDNHKCRGCGKDMDWGYEWVDVHHVQHRSKGGSDDLANLILLCRDCHNSQHPEKQLKWSQNERT